MSIADLLNTASIAAAPAVPSVSATEPVTHTTRQKDKFASFIDANEGREDLPGTTVQDHDKGGAGADARLPADAAETGGEAGAEADFDSDAAEVSSVPASALMQGVIFELLPETSLITGPDGSARPKAGTSQPGGDQVSSGLAAGEQASEGLDADALARESAGDGGLDSGQVNVLPGAGVLMSAGLITDAAQLDGPGSGGRDDALSTSDQSGAEDGGLSADTGTVLQALASQAVASVWAPVPAIAGSEADAGSQSAGLELQPHGAAAGLTAQSRDRYPLSDEVIAVAGQPGTEDQAEGGFGARTALSASVTSSGDDAAQIAGAQMAEAQASAVAMAAEADPRAADAVKGSVALGRYQTAQTLSERAAADDEGEALDTAAADSFENGNELSATSQKVRTVAASSPADHRFTSLPAAEVAEPASGTAPQSPIVKNIMERIDPSMLKDGTVTIVLKPHGLGTIEMSIVSSTDGRMSVAMKVENPLVLDAMRSESRSLEQSFQAKGADVTLQMDLSGQGQARQEQGNRDAVAPQPSGPLVQTDEEDAPPSADSETDAMAETTKSPSSADIRIDILT